MKQQFNIVIPMAGRGSRFTEQGYTDSKPFIDVNGKPMIQRVIENLGMSLIRIICLYWFVYKKILTSMTFISLKILSDTTLMMS